MAALLVDGQDTVKGGGCDIEPLGNSNIILHILVHLAAADHKHMRAAQHIRTYLDYPIEVVARKLKVRPNTISKARRKIARELRKKLV